jgi:hypothetical protein
MSRKWQRVKKWDAENLTGPFAPVRWILAALSSITLAVILLVFIALYGALASIPIGLVALAPTWGVIALTATLSALVAGGLLVGLTRLSVPASKPGWRFSLAVLAGLVGAVAGAWAWLVFAWPGLRYDPVSGEGLRFFASFVDAYDKTTLRRLPGVEMTELEFYSWWPLRIVLLLFVINMMVATIRRIEFTFKNLGVLTVHTGIIVIALGSIYYQGLKKEGDTLLRAGMPNAAGEPTPGEPVRGFWDNTAVALWVAQRDFSGRPLWDSRRLSGIPRYNDYNLLAGIPERLRPVGPDADALTVLGPLASIDPRADRVLDIPVPGAEADPTLGITRVDPDIRFRVVGYAEYAREDESLIVPPEAAGGEGGGTPIRVVELLSRVPDENGNTPDPDTPAFAFTLRPDRPAGRISEGQAFAVEYTRDMPADRMTDLLSAIPESKPFALVIEIPSAPNEDGSVPRVVVEARPGLRHRIGETGWAVGVREVLPEPPFPIITPGYEGATSSVAIVEITPPEGESYDRYVYHRFPEINQDLFSTREDGRPNRRDADPAIRVSFIDASKLQLYFNERTEADGTVTTDLIVREPGRAARLFADIEGDEKIVDVVDRIDFRIASRIDNGVTVRHPVPIPEADRDGQRIGTHAEALLGVEVSVEGSGWSEVVWVPYLQYLGTDPDAPRTVALPDGRSVTLQFGRVWHAFPGFSVQLLNFEMIAYDHRGAPRDYQSLVRVSPVSAEAVERFEGYEHVTKLNAPLQAPYIWEDSRGLMANIALRLTNGMNPEQFKLSQAGWDREGWMQTQQMADAGQLARPFARYTILQVGNNPGIHVIALGGILMAVGIPWAFYVKPWLVKREKARLALAATSRGTRANPGADRVEEQGDEITEDAPASATEEGTGEPVRQP